MRTEAETWGWWFILYLCQRLRQWLSEHCRAVFHRIAVCAEGNTADPTATEMYFDLCFSVSFGRVMNYLSSSHGDNLTECQSADT